MYIRWMDEELEESFRDLEETRERLRAQQDGRFLHTCRGCRTPNSMLYRVEDDTFRCIACRVVFNAETCEGLAGF